MGKGVLFDLKQAHSNAAIMMAAKIKACQFPMLGLRTKVEKHGLNEDVT